MDVSGDSLVDLGGSPGAVQVLCQGPELDAPEAEQSSRRDLWLGVVPVTRPVGQVSAATAVNWSIMSLWWARSDGVRWIRCRSAGSRRRPGPGRPDGEPVRHGAELVVQDPPCRLDRGSGWARPIFSEAMVDSRRSRTSDSLVGK